MREDVQFRLLCFYDCPPPLGISGEPRYKLIDADKFGITLEKCNRTEGWALKVFRVRKDGHYHHGHKITVLFAIERGDPRVPESARGSVENLRRWIHTVQGIGTTTVVFNDFVDMICTDIETDPIPDTDDDRILMWDNLTSYHSAYVHQTVMGRPGNRFSTKFAT